MSLNRASFSAYQYYSLVQEYKYYSFIPYIETDYKSKIRKENAKKLRNVVSTGLGTEGNFQNFLLKHSFYDPRLLMFIAAFADVATVSRKNYNRRLREKRAKAKKYEAKLVKNHSHQKSPLNLFKSESIASSSG